jgi:hypothetical protein
LALWRRRARRLLTPRAIQHAINTACKTAKRARQRRRAATAKRAMRHAAAVRGGSTRQIASPALPL